MSAADLVFGYGSLALGARPTAELTGMRREWNVAMDNSLTIPGYKYYVDAATGARPEVFVTFLNLVDDPEQTVNGALLALGAGPLAHLDERERNYQRVDVSDLMAEPSSGRVWAYMGRDDARARFEEAHRAGRAVVGRAYLTAVRAGFELAGTAELSEFDRSTIPPPCPVVDLRRVEVPPGSG